MSFRSSESKKSGFTLVEMLVVVSVIGILIAMVFPAIQAVRSIARRTSCSNNMRNVVASLHLYEASHESFPKPVDENRGSFFLELAPHLDQEYIYKRFRESLDTSTGETWDDRFVELSDIQLPTLNCPGLGSIDHQATILGLGKYTTQYYGIGGPIGTGNSTDGSETYNYSSFSPEPAGGPVSLEGLFSPAENGKYDKIQRGFADVRDGKSNTFAFGEVAYGSARGDGTTLQFAGWAFGAKFDASDVIEIQFTAKTLDHGINEIAGDTNDVSFGSSHSSGAMFAFADGSVSFISERIPLNVLKTLGSIASIEKPEEYDQF